MAKDKIEARARRKKSIRKRISGDAERPRLSVYRSNKHIYAQVINDETGATIVAAGSLGREHAKEGGKAATATQIGEHVATLCKEKGITKVVFDRNGYLYHGRVRALAEAAREGGLDF
jgi:large subunit ribosomal protein L18